MTFVFKQNGEKTMAELGGSSPLLAFAIGWENKPKAGILGKLVGAEHQNDLDLSCAIYDDHGDRIDCVWYAQLRSKDGAIRHRGDETVGEDAGDDELMVIDLNQLDDSARTLFFVVSCFSDCGMGNVDTGFWRLFDGQTKREIARYEFHGHKDASAKIVMRLQRDREKGLAVWRVMALDAPASGKNIQEIFPEIRTLLEA